MTSDPNDVDAWLNEFAPEVDALNPPAADAVVRPDEFLQSVRAEVQAPAESFSAPADTFSAPASESWEPAASVLPDTAAAPVAADPAGAAATTGLLGFDSEPEDLAWSEDFERATGGVPVVDGDAGVGLEGEWSDDEPKSRFSLFFEWAPILIGAVIVAALVRTFVFQAFYIPSGSMIPTLNEDDRVLVNKLSYDFNDIGWGDIVVFKRPANQPGEVPDLIKRVMALPGDRIEFFNGDVYVNNVRVSETYLNTQGATNPLLTSPGSSIPGCIDATNSACTVPEGFVFVMGDNRGASTDSRRFGPIPTDDIVGRAMVRVWPLGEIALF